MAPHPHLVSTPRAGTPVRAGAGRRWTVRGLLLLSGLLYALHFAHLTADFPHDSPWNDWAKYTDEGWYGDGAIRHFVLGHWFLPGDFNPAVAMPVWPLLEAFVFRVTGVSLGAARALAVTVFGAMLLALYNLLRRHGAERRQEGAPGFAPVLAVLFAAASPFLFVFDRLAVLEPMLAALAVLALWSASFLGTPRGPRVAGTVAFRPWVPGVALGTLLAMAMLTKPTAVALLPAFLLYLWVRAGGRPGAFLRLAAVPAGVGAGLWLGYFLLLVRPRYLPDFRYLFDANAYTGFQLEPLSVVLVNTVSDVQFLGPVLCGLFVVLLAGLGLTRPRFFCNALVPALLLWIGGYLLLLGYHNNLQPRYYLLIAVPVTALVALGLDEVLQWTLTSPHRAIRGGGALGVAACVLALAVPGVLEEIEYLRHPEYSYVEAARRIAAIVRADRTRSPLLLSISGSDLTLMTGLPSIDDDFGTLDLDQRLRRYRPGWYVAWNQIDDDKMDAFQGLYRPVRVAALPAMDDPDRNLLILYRLDPVNPPSPLNAVKSAPSDSAKIRPRRPMPRPLVTRSGQQPATVQLRH